MRVFSSRDRVFASFLCAGLCSAVAASCATGGGDNASGSGAATGAGAATGSATGGAGTSTTSGSGSGGQCTACVTTTECGSGSDCAQFAGDTYCATDCTGGGACPSGTACTPVNTAEGQAVSVCVPVMNPCGGRMGTSSTTAAATGTSATTTGSSGGTCAHSPCSAGAVLASGCDPCATTVCAGDPYCCNNSWDTQCVSEAMSACGPSCSGGASGAASTSSSTTSTSTSSGGTCAHSPCTAGAVLASGCDACATTVCASDSYCCTTKWNAQCVSEAMSACGPSCSGGTSSSSTSSSSTSSTSSTSSSSSGGPVSTLSFAVVGDTRPPNEDDTSGYPTSVITKIWQDIEAASPRPAFAVTTGDYMFANPSGGQAALQVQLYLTARSNFTNTVYPAMGNHECTGATASNCGSGNKDGITNNYTQFMTKMLAPLSQTKPYYTIDVNGTNNAWTAKFVFVACNAWNSTQASWLASELSKSTTYTFVVRHEGTTATTSPCLSGSGSMNADTIIGKYPHTLLIAGHTHTYAYYSSEKQVIVGNGGAPLTGSVNYGYVIARQQANGSILFTEYDYQTNKATSSFTVQ